MSIFESLNKTSDSVTDIGKKYATTTFSYVKLKSFYLTTLSISLVTKMVLIGGLATIGTLFLSIGLAITLGNHFDNIPLGFFLVGLLFLFIGLIVYMARKFIDKNIIKSLSTKFFKSEQN